MFYENSFLNLRYYYDPQRSTFLLAFPPNKLFANPYQENINKCLNFINYEYNLENATKNDNYNGPCNVASNSINSTCINIKDNSGANIKKIHSHETKDEQDACHLCRRTTAYLLTPPHINYLDYRFKYADSKVSLNSDKVPYNEYKLFDNFNFSKVKRMTHHDAPFSPLVDTCIMTKDLTNEALAECDTNGRTVDDVERSMQIHGFERFFPLLQNKRQYIQPGDFHPCANTIPMGFLQQHNVNNDNNNIYQQRMKAQQQHQVFWKKPTVIDPRLSSEYDAVFPSLELSCKQNFTKESAMKNQFNTYFCVFCKSNNEPLEVYASHILRDSTGRVCCPILRKFRCSLCGAFGDNAHTRKYCPFNPEGKMLPTNYQPSCYT